jgi:hypothetical protein
LFIFGVLLAYVVNARLKATESHGAAVVRDCRSSLMASRSARRISRAMPRSRRDRGLSSSASSRTSRSMSSSMGAADAGGSMPTRGFVA